MPFRHLWLITELVTRLTRRATLDEQELLTLPEHLSSRPVFSGVRITRSLVLYVCFVDRCLSLCPFSFGHCVVFSSIYGFWLLLWYLQLFLNSVRIFTIVVWWECLLRVVRRASAKSIWRKLGHDHLHLVGGLCFCPEQQNRFHMKQISPLHFWNTRNLQFC